MAPNSKDFLINIIRELVTEKIDFIICGGVAAVLHGVERMTMDLDLSLDMNTENIKRFLKVMDNNNLKPRVPIPAESLLDKEVRDTIVQTKNALVFTFLDPDKPYKQIDIFLTHDMLYQKLIHESNEVYIDEITTIRILSIPKLIELKKAIMPMRDKDIFDINSLSALLSGKNNE